MTPRYACTAAVVAGGLFASVAPAFADDAATVPAGLSVPSVSTAIGAPAETVVHVTDLVASAADNASQLEAADDAPAAPPAQPTVASGVPDDSVTAPTATAPVAADDAGAAVTTPADAPDSVVAPPTQVVPDPASAPSSTAGTNTAHPARPATLTPSPVQYHEMDGRYQPRDFHPVSRPITHDSPNEPTPQPSPTTDGNDGPSPPMIVVPICSEISADPALQSLCDDALSTVADAVAGAGWILVSGPSDGGGPQAPAAPAAPPANVPGAISTPAVCAPGGAPIWAPPQTASSGAAPDAVQPSRPTGAQTPSSRSANPLATAAGRGTNASNADPGWIIATTSTAESTPQRAGAQSAPGPVATPASAAAQPIQLRYRSSASAHVARRKVIPPRSTRPVPRPDARPRDAEPRSHRVAADASANATPAERTLLLALLVAAAGAFALAIVTGTAPRVGGALDGVTTRLRSSRLSAPPVARTRRPRGIRYRD